MGAVDVERGAAAGAAVGGEGAVVGTVVGVAPEFVDLDAAEGNRAVVEVFAAGLDADVEVRSSSWVHRVPPQAVVGRAASSSRVGLMDDVARATYLDRIRELLDTHPDTRGREELELDYVTTAWRLVPRR